MWHKQWPRDSIDVSATSLSRRSTRHVPPPSCHRHHNSPHPVLVSVSLPFPSPTLLIQPRPLSQTCRDSTEHHLPPFLRTKSRRTVHRHAVPSLVESVYNGDALLPLSPVYFTFGPTASRNDAAVTMTITREGMDR